MESILDKVRAVSENRSDMPMGEFTHISKINEGYDIETDIENEDKTHYFTVTEGSELYEEIDNVFSMLSEKVTITPDSDLFTLALKSTSDWSNSNIEYPFYTQDDCEGQFMIGVTSTLDSQLVKEEIFEIIADIIGELDSNVTSDSVVDCQCFFDDLEEIQLGSIETNVETPTPHRHFSNVSSLEEYVEKSKDYEDVNQNSYTVLHKLSNSKQYSTGPKIDEWVQDRLEEIMRGYIEETLETDIEHRIEGESITIDEDGLSVSYFVFTPMEEVLVN